MNLKDTMRKNAAKIAEAKRHLDLDTFGEIMDRFIDESAITLLVTKEEGSKEWKVEGVGLGSVMDFYVFLNAVQPIYRKMLKDMNGEMDAEKLAEALTDLLKDNLIEAAKEKGD